MFHFLSWGHLLVLALGAMFIFGPERLPTLARDAARGLKRLRTVLDEVRAHVDDEMGEDFAELRDLDLRRYRPRTFIRDQLFGANSASPSGEQTSPRYAAVLPVRGPEARRLPPPFDRDAT